MSAHYCRAQSSRSDQSDAAWSRAFSRVSARGSGQADDQHPYRVDLPWLTFHSLRDTLATRMEKAHGIEAAAAALGNTVAVVAAHYVERPAIVEVDPTALDDEAPEPSPDAPSDE